MESQGPLGEAEETAIVLVSAQNKSAEKALAPSASDERIVQASVEIIRDKFGGVIPEELIKNPPMLQAMIVRIAKALKAAGNTALASML